MSAKYKLISGYIFLFWLAMFLCGIWAFKILIQASLAPEWVAGLVGGAIWALVMRALWNVVSESLNDFFEELKPKRRPSANSGG